ncbi:MAG: hypothetical protein ACXVOI_00685 [Tumebacillaceae bacterium]
MPDQQQEQQQSGSAGGKQQGQASKMPALPKAMEKRLSMKWLTLEALSNVMARLEANGTKSRVVLLTAGGQVEGTLCELKDSYAESFTTEGDHLRPDVASMVTHVRTELLRTYEQEEQDLKLVDHAPILSLTDVVVTNGTGMRQSLLQLTLFADQVIGFSLSEVPRLQ